jgi:hypothetical protein
MTSVENENICLAALCTAFCDGAKPNAKRAHSRGLLEQLELPNAAQLASRALLNRTALAEAVNEPRSVATLLAVPLLRGAPHRALRPR